MSRESVLARGRQFAAGGFTDTCRVEHREGLSTHPLTGVVTTNWRTVYEGECKVQGSTAGAAGPVVVGEAALRTASCELHLPVAGSEGILTDDRVTLLTCSRDAELVGRVYSITGVSHKSFATTRKLPMQEVVS